MLKVHPCLKAVMLIIIFQHSKSVQHVSIEHHFD